MSTGATKLCTATCCTVHLTHAFGSESSLDSANYLDYLGTSSRFFNSAFKRKAKARQPAVSISSLILPVTFRAMSLTAAPLLSSPSALSRRPSLVRCPLRKDCRVPRRRSRIAAQYKSPQEIGQELVQTVQQECRNFLEVCPFRYALFAMLGRRTLAYQIFALRGVSCLWRLRFVYFRPVAVPTAD